MLRVIVGGACLLASAWICVGNAWILILDLRRRPAPSWLPLIGGLLGVTGFLLLPFSWAARVWWVPLFLDWGSIPGFTHTLLWHLRHRWSR